MAGAPEGEAGSGGAREGNVVPAAKARAGVESVGAAGAAGDALPAPLQAVELKPLGEALAAARDCWQRMGDAPPEVGVYPAAKVL